LLAVTGAFELPGPQLVTAPADKVPIKTKH